MFVAALVLPFRPYVESVSSHKPSQILDISGEEFETQVETAVKVFQDIDKDGDGKINMDEYIGDMYRDDETDEAEGELNVRKPHFMMIFS